jgi:hypothetical protein
MTRLCALTRPLLLTWPVLVALLAMATVSHDVSMAAHPHEVPIPAGVVAANISHSLSGMHDGLLYETDLSVHPPLTGTLCPTDSCPELTDCGLVRVLNPIPAPDPNRAAVGVIDVSSRLQLATGADMPVASIDPTNPPGVRRALLQVFLN